MEEGNESNGDFFSKSHVQSLMRKLGKTEKEQVCLQWNWSDENRSFVYYQVTKYLK